MALPTLEELSALTLSEIEQTIQENLPPGWKFDFTEERGGVWEAEIRQTVVEPSGEVRTTVLFRAEYPDRRITLLNAFGFLWTRGHTPSSTVWQRRRHDLRSAARTGVMHVPGAENIPDPEDLDPYSVYRDT